MKLSWERKAKEGTGKVAIHHSSQFELMTMVVREASVTLVWWPWSLVFHLEFLGWEEGVAVTSVLVGFLQNPSSAAGKRLATAVVNWQ